MKALLATILLLIVSGSASAQTKDNGTIASLQLTTIITEQIYCDSGYSDMARVNMSLQLTYINAGTWPLILYKGGNLAHYILISLNEQNAKNKKYELDQHVGWVTSGEPKLAEGFSPGAEFVVLSPGETYKTETDISFPIAVEENSQFLKPGKYVMQIVVDAWPGNKSQFERLRSKWKKTGFLWGTPIKSQPIAIEVERQPKIVSCKGNV